MIKNGVYSAETKKNKCILSINIVKIVTFYSNYAVCWTQRTSSICLCWTLRTSSICLCWTLKSNKHLCY